MRESYKAMLAALVLANGIFIVVVFAGAFDSYSVPAVWALRIGSIASAAGLLSWLVWLTTRPDKVTDFLRPVFGQTFERSGICFVIVPTAVDGVCYLTVIYQNRYDRKCDVRVVVRSAKSFWPTGAKGPEADMSFACEGAAVGIASTPWPVAEQMQGRSCSLEIAAGVSYPDGRGTMVRFRDGKNVGRISAAGRVAVTAAGALGGAIALHSPARIVLLMPSDVAEEVPADASPTSETLWRPDDPPLDLAHLKVN